MLFKIFEEYSKQDSRSLFDLLLILQKDYIRLFNIEICSIVSATALSKNIFRLHFQETDIPVLKKSQDRFARQGYFGGHCDVFKAFVKKVFHYDGYKSVWLGNETSATFKFYKTL